MTVLIIDAELELLDGMLKREKLLIKKYPDLDTAKQLIQILTVDIKKLKEKRQRITEAVYSIQDDRIRQIAKYKLIDGLTFDEIGEAMFYSRKTIFRLWKEARLWEDIF